MEEIKTQRDYLKISNADGLHILEATAAWCEKCKAIEPFVQKLVKKYPEAKFYKYDTDEALDITQELGVTGMPTFHLFKDGDMQSSVTGAKAKALEDAIAKCYEGKIEENAE